VEVALVEYMKMMQANPALDHLHTIALEGELKLHKKSSTLFKNGTRRWGWLR